MIKKILILIFVLYFLIIFQTSFLVHFNVAGLTLNLATAFVIIWNFLESPKKKTGIILAFIGGFFLDIFSSHFIGFNVLILLTFSVFIKYFLKKYVRIPFFEKV